MIFQHRDTSAALVTHLHIHFCGSFPRAIFEVAGILLFVVVEEVASWGDVTEDLALLCCVDVAIEVLSIVIGQSKALIVISVFQNCGFLTLATLMKSACVFKTFKNC